MNILSNNVSSVIGLDGALFETFHTIYEMNGRIYERIRRFGNGVAMSETNEEVSVMAPVAQCGPVAGTYQQESLPVYNAEYESHGDAESYQQNSVAESQVESTKKTRFKWDSNEEIAAFMMFAQGKKIGDIAKDVSAIYGRGRSYGAIKARLIKILSYVGANDGQFATINTAMLANGFSQEQINSATAEIEILKSRKS